MSKLQEIKQRYNNRLEPSDEDIEWLIEQAERYEKIRSKIIEHTINKNYEALIKLADS